MGNALVSQNLYTEKNAHTPKKNTSVFLAVWLMTCTPYVVTSTKQRPTQNAANEKDQPGNLPFPPPFRLLSFRRQRLQFQCWYFKYSRSGTGNCSRSTSGVVT